LSGRSSSPRCTFGRGSIAFAISLDSFRHLIEAEPARQLGCSSCSATAENWKAHEFPIGRTATPGQPYCTFLRRMELEPDLHMQTKRSFLAYKTNKNLQKTRNNRYMSGTNFHKSRFVRRQPPFGDLRWRKNQACHRRIRTIPSQMMDTPLSKMNPTNKSWNWGRKK
jgi:hypothetical protein